MIVRVRASIRLLSTDEGGRTAPLVGGFRPNHNFLGADNREMGMGFINLGPGIALHPGETAEVETTLLPWPKDIDLAPGRQWRIQEGPKVIGIGTILEVIADNRAPAG